MTSPRKTNPRRTTRGGKMLSHLQRRVSASGFFALEEKRWSKEQAKRQRLVTSLLLLYSIVLFLKHFALHCEKQGATRGCVINCHFAEFQVKRHINFYKTEGTSAIAKMLREYMSKEESEADVDNDYRDMDDLILGKKGPYKFVDFD